MQENVSLKHKTFFQTGGSARWYTEPTSEKEFQYALHYAQEHNIPIFILGAGANILISDEGFDGLVIRPKITTLSYNNDHITCGAGVSINDTITCALSNNLGGLEVFSGIPGTIGGASYINIHYFEHALSDFLAYATIINKITGETKTVDASWFQFGYDQSTLFAQQYFLVSATFKLNKLTDLETSFAQGRRHEIIRHRERRYPLSHTCGSFFRNFFKDEVTLERNNIKMIFVAYYLDKIGVKGELSVGDAIVSYQHANMIVNRGNAISKDITDLARTMQEMVYKEYGIIPQPECQLIGFKENPLLDKHNLDATHSVSHTLNKTL